MMARASAIYLQNIANGKYGDSIKITKDLLWNEYVVLRQSVSAISSKLNRSVSTIRYFMKKYNIPARKPWEMLVKNCCGERAASWKGGIINTKDGYVLIYSPDHPRKTRVGKGGNGGYVSQHRLAMEKHLGRYLNKWEVIHHINGIRNDNRIENLQLLPSNEHNKEVQKVYQENLGLKKAVVALYLLNSFGRGAV